MKNIPFSELPKNEVTENFGKLLFFGLIFLTSIYGAVCILNIILNEIN